MRRFDLLPKIERGACLYLVLFLLCFALAGCAGEKTSGPRNPEYENLKIVVEGDLEEPREITVGEMRALPRKELNASLTRTTGLLEEFKAAGPTVKDVWSTWGLTTRTTRESALPAGQLLLPGDPEIMAERELILL